MNKNYLKNRYKYHNDIIISNNEIIVKVLYKYNFILYKTKYIICIFDISQNNCNKESRKEKIRTD